MIVYKVVRVTDDGFESAFARTRCRYAVGETTARPEGGGPLAAFRDYYGAARWRGPVDLHDTSAILQCEATEAADGWRGLWYWSPERDRRHVFTDVPEGTVFCDKITPVEVVS